MGRKLWSRIENYYLIRIFIRLYTMQAMMLRTLNGVNKNTSVDLSNDLSDYVCLRVKEIEPLI